MSNLSLTAEQRALANDLGATGRTERLTAYKQARILTALNDTGLSLRDLEVIAEDKKVASLKKTRIGVLITAYRAAAEGTVTGTPDQATFEATLKDHTDKNREAGKAKRDAAKAKKDAEATVTEGEGVPQGDSPTRVATSEDAIRALWLLVTEFGEDAKFAKAIADAHHYVAEPVAA